jgi:thymidine kinase
LAKSEVTDTRIPPSGLEYTAYQQRGRIELIMGCMFAGKTTELLRRCRKHEITGKKILRVKFSADKRYGGKFKMSTHGGLQTDAIPVQFLRDLPDEWRQYDVIGVDEGQFFTDIVEFAELFANSGKIVIVSSLQGTFLRGVFPNILALLPKCEKIKKLTAICKLCKESASFTFRTASKDSMKMIGGDDMYMPLCRDCHKRESNLNKENAFSGDPTVLSMDTEEQNSPPKNRKTDVSKETSETSTTSSKNSSAGGSPQARSFSQKELDQDNNIQLRHQQTA